MFLSVKGLGARFQYLYGNLPCQARALPRSDGATAHQLMAIFGSDTPKEAEKYIAEAD
jgi:hypothetical protein